MKSKLLKVFIIIVAVAAVFFLAVRCYFRLPVREYYKASEKGFIIPDCGKGFIAQGLDYDKEADVFIVTGYTKDGSASPIYTVSPSDKKNHKTVRMLNADGSEHTGHAGGIAVAGDYIYVAGGHGNCLFVFSRDEVLNAADNASVKCLGKFMLEDGNDEVGVAFVTVNGDSIIAGEFYKDPEYPTVDSHKFNTPAGDYNQALAVEYKLDASCEYGINPEPECVYSLPDLAQGMVVNNGKMYISTSWGVSDSHIYAYDMSQMSSSNITLLGKKLPMYFADSTSLVKDMKIAPMSEEIIFKDGMLYTMCESASNKYIFGKFTSAKWCYRTTVK